MLARTQQQASTSLLPCTCGFVTRQQSFSSSTSRSPRLANYLPSHTANGPPPLSRKVRHSLTQRDRIVGLAKTGEKLPFRETEWGLRFARKKRTEDREKKTEERKATERSIAAEKREEALVSPSSLSILTRQEMTASLGPLTEDTLRLFYQAVMSPPALEARALEQLPPPEEPVRAGILDELERLLIESDHKQKALVADDQAKLRGILDSFDAKITAAEEAEARCVVAEPAETSELARKKPVEPVTAPPLAVSNLATLDEWKALAVEAAQRGDAGDVRGGSDGDKVASVAFDALTRRDDVQLLQTALTACQAAQIALPVDAREALVLAMVRHGELIGAQHQLRYLEELSAPASQNAYQVVIEALAKAKQATMAWNLFGHMRLAAHSTPTASIYATMIKAAATGDAPERAMDLRREMEESGIAATAETYTAVILACARGPPEYYADALRQLRQMLHEGFSPTKDTFQAILHAAMRNRDLARARWTFEKMCEAAQTGQVELGPDALSIRRLFHAYAVYQPPVDSRRLAELDQAADVPAKLAATDVSETQESDETAFPGPMPQTKGETVLAIRATMQRWLNSLKLQLPLTNMSPRPAGTDPALAAIPLDASAIGAYLSALARQGAAQQAIDDFRVLYSAESPSISAFAGLLESIVRFGHRTDQQNALALFGQYRRQYEPITSTRTLVEQGANIAKIYASTIRLLLQLDRGQEALRIFKDFMTRYPPRLLTDYAEQVASAQSAAPSSPVRLASRAFPETSTIRATASGSMPPFLRFRDVHGLYDHFKRREAKAQYIAVSSIAKHYEQALEWAQRIAEVGSKTIKRGAYDQSGPAPEFDFSIRPRPLPRAQRTVQLPTRL